MRSFRDEYKPTEIYRNLVKSHKILPELSHDQLRYIPNYSSVGITWDAKHLDKFLDTKWGSNRLATIPDMKSDHSREPQTARTPQSDYRSDSTSPSPSKKTNLSRLSLKPLIHKEKERESSYISNFVTDFSIRETRNRANELATTSRLDLEKLSDYYEKGFVPLERKFDQNKLVYSEQPVAASPQRNREQLEEAKTNQNELRKWKEKNMELNKKSRVFKAAFRSGVLGLDNPMNEKTLIYKKEFESLDKTRKDIEKIEKRRFDQLRSVRDTNHVIEFSNVNFNEGANVTERNHKIRVNMEHTKRWENTKDRLFDYTPTSSSVERALNLRNQETKGKQWNIISSANLNDIAKTPRK